MYPHSKTYGMQPFDILRRDSKLSEVQFLNCQNDSKSTRHANRLINFYEYDARRDLQKRGKILKHLCWPTIFILKKNASYFAIYAVRNVFSPPSHPHITNSESGGACGEVISKEGIASGRSQPKSVAIESGSSLFRA